MIFAKRFISCKAAIVSTPIRYYLYLLVILTCCLSTGCKNYTYTFNEQPIFNPPSLFDDYDIADPALNNCLKQAIIDTQATSANQLTNLNCSSAGIKDLSGLERFTGLSHINLNQNLLVNIDSLLLLQHLVIVRLERNDQLSCVDTGLLAKQVSGSLSLPKHCDQ